MVYLRGDGGGWWGDGVFEFAKIMIKQSNFWSLETTLLSLLS